jgi:hypothetical protein
MLNATEVMLLVPNRTAIRGLREKRGWTLDDAFAAARTRGLRVSRNTLRTLEMESSVLGCRLETLGEILALYDLPDEALLTLVTHNESRASRTAAPPKRRSRLS